MIAADIEIVSIAIAIAIASYAGLEVLAAWRSESRIGCCVGGTGRGDSEGER